MTAIGRALVALLVAVVVLAIGARGAAAAPRSVAVSAARWPAAVPAAGWPAGLVPPLGPAAGPVSGPSVGGLPCVVVLNCNPLAGLGSDIAHSMAEAVFETFGRAVADGVKAVLQQVAVAITKTTEVKLDRSWFQDHFGVIRALAIVILLPLMLVGLISAVIHRDASQLWRAGGVYVPVAIVGGAAAVGVTDTAVKVTDALTTAVTGDMAASVTKAMSALGDAITVASTPVTPGAGPFLGIVVLLVLMAGALLIWIELLLRTSAIYVVVLFLPLALSGLVWRGTVGWTRRMVEVLVALILSKFVIVVVIDLAAGMITAGDGIGTILQGATLLLLAAFAPFALLRLVPLVEAGVIGHLERMERRPIAAVSRGANTAVRTALTGFQLASASHMVSQNGGGAKPTPDMSEAGGGELDHVNVPVGWTVAGARGGSPPSAAAQTVSGSPPAPALSSPARPSGPAAGGLSREGDDGD